ncbi:DUF1232 domain-containing protein [Fodinisporobacter ferrooxydans]|uniref:DUF1232 domain-containing protein n=1 Tax=Fodinisporobacter ferrooxydans TaxID=2901836 RepID=A0ABY4CJ46_9BACL|nr:DUF1232 domain-containing protein [Alicyclobacillaceae bacterium MYW30-H2]
MNEWERYGSCIRELLQQKNMTAEELVDFINQHGRITTNKTALSRIMTGKKMPSAAEAELLAQALEAPSLLEAYRLLQEYSTNNDPATALLFYESVDRVSNEDGAKEPITEPEIDYRLLYQILTKLYRSCLSHDVSTQVKDGFLSKLAQVRGFGEMLERLKIMYHCFLFGKSVSVQDRAWLAVAILYFISPIDLIPDYLLPYGYIDDSMVVGFVFYKLHSLLTE